MEKRIILQGEIGCGKSTMLRNILGSELERAEGFQTMRVKEGEQVLGFVLGPANRAGVFQEPTIDPETYQAQAEHLHCFLSFSEKLQVESDVFSGYAASLLNTAVSGVCGKKAAVREESRQIEKFTQMKESMQMKKFTREKSSADSFGFLDEIGGIELLEDTFFDALMNFLQTEDSWVCVFKTEAAAKALSSRVPMGEKYQQRYVQLQQMLCADAEVCWVNINEPGDVQAEKKLREWKITELFR